MNTSTPTPDRHALSFTDARSSFKDILDTADRGGLTVVERGSGSASVVNTTRLLQYLVRNNPANVQVVNEDGAWAMFVPGLPIAAEGATLNEATADLIEALREYAEDWEDHLQAAPNHAGNWALVQIIDASTDEQLAQWLTESHS
jgi:predicted RNase H-like HicB family nuclease